MRKDSLSLRPMLAALGLMVALVAAPQSAFASTIFSNGSPDLVNAFNSDFTNFSYQSADNFILGAQTPTITDVHWWGVYAFAGTAPATDNFTIRVYADNAGTPGALLVNQNIGNGIIRTPTGGNVSGFALYEFSAFVTPVTLTAGTAYWLSIINNTLGDADGDGWYWATSNGNAGNAGQRFGDAGPFANVNVELAFQLTNDAAVPEPATMALTLAGLGALVARRRQRKANS